MFLIFLQSKFKVNPPKKVHKKNKKKVIFYKIIPLTIIFYFIYILIFFFTFGSSYVKYSETISMSLQKIEKIGLVKT